jgi:mono/diheme cytochrome c family protein
MTKPGWAVLGLFESADALIEAIRRLRPRYGTALEAYTPYPVHGIEKELGIPKSHLGKIVLALGLAGLLLAFLFQSWVFTADYQIRFGGKPYFSWASFVPIVFEVTVLLASIAGAVFGMLVLLNKLPHYSHPLLSSRSMPRITRDRFALAVHLEDGLDAAEALAALREAGAVETEEVSGSEDLGTGTLLPIKPVLATGLICLLAGLGTWHLVRLWGELPLINVMDEQNKVLPFRDAFGDGRGWARMPVAGTVARGQLPALWTTPEEAGALLVNPLPASEAVLAEGRRVYETHCLVCHGQLGDGRKLLSDKYTAAPANLHSSRLKEAPDGQLYAVIVQGWNTMAGYGKDIPEDDRWAAVHYLRALQRALDAPESDLQLARELATAAGGQQR